MSWRDPILWFLLTGALLFAADSFRNDGTETIVVDDTVRARISSLWQVQMGTEPSPQELENLVKSWLREEVFYREALRLGLDDEDTIIRRRLVQKIGFLVQDVSDEMVTQEEVAAFYSENRSDYELPTRYTFSQVYFTQESSAAEIMTALAAGRDWRSLGDSSLLQGSYVAKSQRDVERALGTVFAEQLAGLAPGDWQGPLRSTYGWHLVRLEQVASAELPPLAYVERRVKADLQQARSQAAVDRYYENLRERYPVVYQ